MHCKPVKAQIIKPRDAEQTDLQYAVEWRTLYCIMVVLNDGIKTVQSVLESGALHCVYKVLKVTKSVS